MNKLKKIIVSVPSIKADGIFTVVISFFDCAPKAFFSKIDESKNNDAALTKKLPSIIANQR